MTILAALVAARAVLHGLAARRAVRYRRYHQVQVALLAGSLALGLLLGAFVDELLGVAVLAAALAWLLVVPALGTARAHRADRRGHPGRARAWVRTLDRLAPHGRLVARRTAALAAADAVTAAADRSPAEAARLLVASGPVLGTWPAHRRAELAVAAAHGRRDVVDRLLAGPLADVPRSEAAAWRARAERVAADLGPGGGLGDRVLDDLAEELRLDAATTPPAGWRAPLARATGVVLLAVYAGEVVTAADGDADQLVELGAYVPGGEPWRAATAAFLHADLVHLGANLLVLALFGRLLEWRLGGPRAATVYVTAALLGFLLPDWLGLLPADTVAIGASGGLLGLVGAALAGSLRWVRRGGAPRAAQQEVVLLAAVVALQLVVDLSLPGVFGAGHAAGLVVGLATGWALAPPPAPHPRGAELPRARPPG